MRTLRTRWPAGAAVVVAAALGLAGCASTTVDESDLALGPAPRRMPSPAGDEGCDCYEDSLTGGQIFTMYCSYCHNAPSLAERPFANFKNVGAHMRVRANLTGKEYAKLMAWLQRWHDVPPANPVPEPSPKRLIFGREIQELRPQTPAKPEAAPPPEKEKEKEKEKE
jgi:hypothetical protein